MARWTPRVMVRRLPLDARLVRRLLVNYRVDPAALEVLLPAPLRPRLVGGWGVAGLCVIALAGERSDEPSSEPGVLSENAAHRIAVEWDTVEGPQSGVYIARRDTDSIIDPRAGGRIFPGVHHRACFHVTARDGTLRVSYFSPGSDMSAEVTVATDQPFRPSTLFATLEDASEFFSLGTAAYSVTCDPCRLDGVVLFSERSYLEPVDLIAVSSAFFEDSLLFPLGTAYLDSAFLMRDVPVEWRVLPSLRVTPRVFSTASVG